MILLRWYVYQNPGVADRIQVGSYDFAGSYSPEEVITILQRGPKQTYESLTLLEGRSIYDIDAYLAKRGQIQAGEYIRYVTDPTVIKNAASRYEFVESFVDAPTPSLEGLLYPDTYYVSENQSLLPQLIDLQLQAFNTKVYQPYSNEIKNFQTYLTQNGFSISLSWYELVSLVSIVEKEERNNKNKPTIAGIFFNRLQQKMRIDADITLCYGLKTGYEVCTPSLIVRSISDANNLYNTRVHYGLTPTPIANPSSATFEAVLRFAKTDYYYYLHGSDGRIHYGATLSDHNANKQYL